MNDCDCVDMEFAVDSDTANDSEYAVDSDTANDSASDNNVIIKCLFDGRCVCVLCCCLPGRTGCP